MAALASEVARTPAPGGADIGARVQAILARMGPAVDGPGTVTMPQDIEDLPKIQQGDAGAVPAGKGSVE